MDNPGLLSLCVGILTFTVYSALNFVFQGFANYCSSALKTLKLLPVSQFLLSY